MRALFLHCFNPYLCIYGLYITTSVPGAVQSSKDTKEAVLMVLSANWMRQDKQTVVWKRGRAFLEEGKVEARWRG